MSDTSKPGTAGPPKVEVEIAPTSPTGATTLDENGAIQTDGAATEVDLGDDPYADEGEAGAPPKKPEDGATEEAPPKTADALPDYDESNEEVTRQYDERYYTPEGAMNLEALTSEFDANGGKGLNEGTYAYLQKVTGLTKEQMKEVEAGQVARRNEGLNAFYGSVEGGKPAVDAAVAWGKANYTDAQKEAFEAAQRKGPNSPEFRDQLELLMSRSGKAGGQAPGGRRGPPRRGASPARDAGAGNRAPAPGGGERQAPGDTYPTKAAYDEDWTSALREVETARKNNDRDALKKAERRREDVRGKLRRSQPNWK